MLVILLWLHKVTLVLVKLSKANTIFPDVVHGLPICSHMFETFYLVSTILQSLLQVFMSCRIQPLNYLCAYVSPSRKQTFRLNRRCWDGTNITCNACKGGVHLCVFPTFTLVLCYVENPMLLTAHQAITPISNYGGRLL